MNAEAKELFAFIPSGEPRDFCGSLDEITAQVEAVERREGLRRQPHGATIPGGGVRVWFRKEREEISQDAKAGERLWK